MDRPVAIRQATTRSDIALARALFREYADWLNEDLCFQGFAEELATLPGAYGSPSGRLYLAGAAGDAFGCIALRPLGDPLSGVAEVKRLYVQPRARGGQWGLRLARAVIDEARRIGYRELKLDTLERMTHALRLYQHLGFVECEPYYHNPLGAPVYMRLDLETMSA